MASYRDLLQGLRAEIDEIQPPEAAARADAPVFVDVREQDEWDVERIPGAAAPHARPSSSRASSAAVPDKEAPIVVYCESGNALAASPRERSRSSATRTCEPRRRDRRVEARRPAAGDGRRAHARAAAPLQPAHPDSRGRRGGAAEAPRLADPPHRRGRPRLPGLALPRSRGRRHARHRRRRRRRRDEPATPDRPFDGAARRGEGSLRGRHHHRVEPRREGRRLRGAPDVRERRPHHRRGLGRDRRRRRQLPHALPRERRLRLAQHPGRARLDLPLRGTGDGLQAERGPVLPLPLPAAAAAGAGAVVRGGRRARRAAGRDRLAAGERGAQARPRDRLAADRPAAALRRAHATFDEVALRRDPACPVCGESPTITEYVDYVEFCAGPARHT